MRKLLVALLTGALFGSSSVAVAAVETPVLHPQQLEVMNFVAAEGAKTQLILKSNARAWVLRNTEQNPRRIGDTNQFVVRLKDAKAIEMVEQLAPFQVIPDQLVYLNEPIVITENISPAAISGVDTVGMIGADTAHLNGNTGDGVAVAILDTGIDPNHPYFKDAQGNSRIVQEACFVGFGDPDENFPCLNGQSSQVGLGSSDITNHASSVSPSNYYDQNTTWIASGTSAQDWADAMSHGTHVAGLAAGSSNALATVPDTVSGGIAPDADIISIRVFGASAGWYWDIDYDQWVFSAGGAATSDILAAVNWVTNNADTYDIAALNLSLGGGRYYSYCYDSAETAFAAARAAGVAPMVATGNEYYNDSVSWPACAESAIAVGSVTGSDQTSSFSNTGPQIDVLAPGDNVGSAVPKVNEIYTNGWENWSGTSMATPVAAGAFALMRQAHPEATLDEIETAIEDTGTPIDDSQYFDIPRINVDLAIAEIAPPLLAQTITVNGNTSSKIDGTLTLTASASSGLLVTASNLTSGVCTIDSSTYASNTRTVGISFETTGTCTISFAQAGDSTYASAVKTHSVTVTKYAQTLTVTGSTSGDIGGSAQIQAYASSNLLPTAVRSSYDGSICTIETSNVGSVLYVDVDFIGAGDCNIQFSQVGDSLYEAAAPVGHEISIDKADQTLTATTPSSLEYGIPLSFTASSSSNLPVSAASLSSSVCTLSGTQITPIAVGDCVIRFTQAGNSSYNPATAVTRTISVGYQDIANISLLTPKKLSKAITLRWTEPANAVYSGFVKYKLQYRIAYPGKNFGSWLTRYPTTNSYKVTFKQAKYKFQYKVSAIAATSTSLVVSGSAQVK